MDGCWVVCWLEEQASSLTLAPVTLLQTMSGTQQQQQHQRQQQQYSSLSILRRKLKEERRRHQQQQQNENNDDGFGHQRQQQQPQPAVDETEERKLQHSHLQDQTAAFPSSPALLLNNNQSLPEAVVEAPSTPARTERYRQRQAHKKKERDLLDGLRLIREAFPVSSTSTTTPTRTTAPTSTSTDGKSDEVNTRNNDDETANEIMTPTPARKINAEEEEEDIVAIARLVQQQQKERLEAEVEAKQRESAKRSSINSNNVQQPQQQRKEVNSKNNNTGDVTDYNDSDDIDIVAIARQVEEEKKKLKQKQSLEEELSLINASKNKCTMPSIATAATSTTNNDHKKTQSNDEGMELFQMCLTDNNNDNNNRKKKKEKEDEHVSKKIRIENNYNNSSSGSSFMDKDTKRRQRQYNHQQSQQVDGNDADSISQQQKKQRQEHQLETRKDSTNNTLKHKNDDDEDDELWNDCSQNYIQYDLLNHKRRYDDDDDVNDQDFLSRKKIKTTKKKQQQERIKGAHNDGNGKTYSNNIYNNNVLDMMMDEEEQEHLIPEFSNPKLGPPSALVPFTLLKSDIYQIQNGQLVGTEADAAAVDVVDQRGGSSSSSHVVPAAINRYLMPYQRIGIQFMYSVISSGKGCILGDDMGMGKTVQMIALFAALLRKYGKGKDKLILAQRHKQIDQAFLHHRDDDDRALLSGLQSPQRKHHWQELYSNANSWSAILLVAPPSVISNWLNEIHTWGHFAVESLQERDERSAIIHRVQIGRTEILLCGRSLISQDSTLQLINSVVWKLIVVDEYHEFKNRKKKAWQGVEMLKFTSKCQIIGMTGTAMQNDHEELWNLIHLVQPGLLGEWKEFEQNTVRILKLARTKDAKGDVIEIGARRQGELSEALRHVYLARKKSDYLQDSLTQKDEKVMLCEPSEVQKKIYQHILKLPDFVLLQNSNMPCDCGVNQKFFSGYRKLRDRKQRIAYHKQHKHELITRKTCCYQLPWNKRYGERGEAEIDPDAVIWLAQHPNNMACDKCPSCILLPALQKLYKVSGHASLLQVDRRPDDLPEASIERRESEKKLAFAKVALTPDILQVLPGQSYFRDDGIMDDHITLSGKMKVLEDCLNYYKRRGDRALIFAHSTTTLNLIQLYVKAKGYSHLRFDGSTPTKNRQTLIDKFQKDASLFLFLISTKAGGLGINLTAANKVLIFDVSWNPSYDEQAQDRTFRIGQTRDVEVVRLVSRGTVEEQMYLRQVYKVHLTMQTLQAEGRNGGLQPARIFRGVAKDRNRKGELFGLENLLKYKNGSFLEEMWKKAAGAQAVSTMGEQNIHDRSEIANTMAGMTVQQIEGLGDGEDEVVHKNDDYDTNADGNYQRRVEDAAIHHEDFMRQDRGDAALKPGDVGFDEELGGESQNVHVTCAAVCKQAVSGREQPSADRINSTMPDKPIFSSKESPVDLIERESDGDYVDGNAKDSPLRSRTEIRGRLPTEAVTFTPIVDAPIRGTFANANQSESDIQSPTESGVDAAIEDFLRKTADSDDKAAADKKATQQCPIIRSDNEKLEAKTTGLPGDQLATFARDSQKLAKSPTKQAPKTSFLLMGEKASVRPSAASIYIPSYAKKKKKKIIS